jgi:hypothetical protein
VNKFHFYFVSLSTDAQRLVAWRQLGIWLAECIN